MPLPPPSLLMGRAIHNSLLLLFGRCVISFIKIRDARSSRWAAHATLAALGARLWRANLCAPPPRWVELRVRARANSQHQASAGDKRDGFRGQLTKSAGEHICQRRLAKAASAAAAADVVAPCVGPSKAAAD